MGNVAAPGSSSFDDTGAMNLVKLHCLPVELEPDPRPERSKRDGWVRRRRLRLQRVQCSRDRARGRERARALDRGAGSARPAGRRGLERRSVHGDRGGQRAHAVAAGSVRARAVVERGLRRLADDARPGTADRDRGNERRRHLGAIARAGSAREPGDGRGHPARIGQPRGHGSCDLPQRQRRGDLVRVVPRGGRRRRARLEFRPGQPSNACAPRHAREHAAVSLGRLASEHASDRDQRVRRTCCPWGK